MTNLLNNIVRATGFTLGQEVDIWYALHKSLQVLAAKLDDDAGVGNGAGTYEALCFTALINTSITNSQGNLVFNRKGDENFYTIAPTGITNEARHWLMYNYTNAWETLCEQLDADAAVGNGSGTYEALCFTAKFLQIIVDPKGQTDLGNGTTFYFTPGCSDRKMFIEWLYNAIDALETLTEQLDADGTVTDMDYEELSYETYCLINVENAAGSVVGNG